MSSNCLDGEFLIADFGFLKANNIRRVLSITAAIDAVGAQPLTLNEIIRAGKAYFSPFWRSTNSCYYWVLQLCESGQKEYSRLPEAWDQIQQYLLPSSSSCFYSSSTWFVLGYSEHFIFSSSSSSLLAISMLRSHRAQPFALTALFSR